jgi:outer membrane protein
MLKKLVVILAVTLLSTSAMAESVNGRVGITGKIGFNAPLQDVTVTGKADATVDTGFAGGGGLIYGLNDKLALELDALVSPSSSVSYSSTINLGDLQTTDISLGLQYRFMTDRHLVPYVGAGMDFIKGDIANSTVNWSYGGHVSGGVDYFLNKSIAMSAEVKYVVGSVSDITLTGVTVGRFNPMSVVGTVGCRLFLSENWAD